MSKRAQDWIRQSERDVALADIAKREEYYEWACFSSQQAAEKAIKGLYQELSQLAWGHSVRALLEELRAHVEVPEEMIEAGKVLDKFYVLARYPNGFASGAPTDYFTAREAEEAILHARQIIGFCHDHLAGC